MKKILTAEDVMITRDFTLKQKIIILKYLLSKERVD